MNFGADSSSRNFQISAIQTPFCPDILRPRFPGDHEEHFATHGNTIRDFLEPDLEVRWFGLRFLRIPTNIANAKSGITPGVLCNHCRRVMPPSAWRRSVATEKLHRTCDVFGDFAIADAVLRDGLDLDRLVAGGNAVEQVGLNGVPLIDVYVGPAGLTLLTSALG